MRIVLVTPSVMRPSVACAPNRMLAMTADILVKLSIVEHMPSACWPTDRLSACVLRDTQETLLCQEAAMTSMSVGLIPVRRRPSVRIQQVAICASVPVDPVEILIARDALPPRWRVAPTPIHVRQVSPVSRTRIPATVCASVDRVTSGIRRMASVRMWTSARCREESPSVD